MVPYKLPRLFSGRMLLGYTFASRRPAVSYRWCIDGTGIEGFTTVCRLLKFMATPRCYPRCQLTGDDAGGSWQQSLNLHEVEGSSFLMLVDEAYRQPSHAFVSSLITAVASPSQSLNSLRGSARCSPVYLLALCAV